jgi:methyl-accepting chemotaxis protein
LLAGGITLLLRSRIVRPLRDAATVADRIAKGEMQTPIPPGGKDETGTLLNSMTVMQGNIREAMTREKEPRRPLKTAWCAGNQPRGRDAGGARRQIVMSNSTLRGSPQNRFQLMPGTPS